MGLHVHGQQLCRRSTEYGAPSSPIRFHLSIAMAALCILTDSSQLPPFPLPLPAPSSPAATPFFPAAHKTKNPTASSKRPNPSPSLLPLPAAPMPLAAASFIFSGSKETAASPTPPATAPIHLLCRHQQPITDHCRCRRYSTIFFSLNSGQSWLCLKFKTPLQNFKPLPLPSLLPVTVAVEEKFHRCHFLFLKLRPWLPVNPLNRRSSSSSPAATKLPAALCLHLLGTHYCCQQIATCDVLHSIHPAGGPNASSFVTRQLWQPWLPLFRIRAAMLLPSDQAAANCHLIFSSDLPKHCRCGTEIRIASR